MWLIWLALVVVSFFVGKYAGDVVMKAVADAAVWLWNKIKSIFKKK